MGILHNCKYYTRSVCLNIVKFGLTMEFVEIPVCQLYPPLISLLWKLKLLIQNFPNFCVILNTTREPTDYVSRIFTRAKKDGSYRMILNLKTLNEFLKFKPWKLESIKDALDLITEGCYFGSNGLKVYTIAPLFMKLTKNIWNCSERKNTINLFSFPMDFYQLWESLKMFWLLHLNF